MPTPFDQRAIIASTHAHIDSGLKGLFDPSAPLALLDFPDHDNVGDSAIYVGEVSWLAQHGGIPSYVAGVERFDWLEMERRIGDGPILLHGGGNFGDIWPWYHAFRETVLWRYRGRPVIQLPQSLSFSSQAAIDQTARVIERHGAFTLLVRDRPSYDFATRWFNCEIRLSPDMAFAMGSLSRGTPSQPLLMLLRKDREEADPETNQMLSAENGATVVDWHKETADWVRSVDRRSERRGFFRKERGVDRLQAMLQHRADARLNRGLDLLRQGEFVITDRLHAHILCVLLGIPHCVVDNGFAKFGSFMDAWHIDAAGVWRVSSIGEALTLYHGLAR